MSFYTETIKATWLPWRLRKSLEKWTETTARSRYPGLYNLLYFGRTNDIIKPVTRRPGHHFFGYYDKSPWNKSGSLLLGHESQFNDHPPSADETVKIGIILLNEGNRFQALAETSAWNWQQGAMLQWHPKEPENLFLHNDRRGGNFIGIVRDTTGKEVFVFDRPIYAVAPDGRHGYSLNFARLHKHRPGYGYAGVSDPWYNDPHPVNDGIYSIDLKSGESRLIVSLNQLATDESKTGNAGCLPLGQPHPSKP